MQPGSSSRSILAPASLPAFAARLAAAQPGFAGTPPTPPPTFWAEHGDAIVVALVVAVLTTLLVEPIKAGMAKLGRALDRRLAALGVRFARRYVRGLVDEHRWLELIGVYKKGDLHAPRLEEVYVSLRLAAGDAEAGERLSWSRAFTDRHDRVVVLGPPGSGKSTLLDYLALVFAGPGAGPDAGGVRHTLRDELGRPFPLFVRLRDLGADGQPDDLVELLAAVSPSQPAPAGFFRRRLERGGCAVLLDGLDEVLDERRHRRAVDEIRRLARDFPDNLYVVTCRVAGWRNQLPGFRRYEIERFADDDVRRFVTGWYRAVLAGRERVRLGPRPDDEALRRAEAKARAEATARADALWEALGANHALFAIARNPLVLSLITLVHYHRQADLPRGRAQLYEECLRILLELWDPQRGLPKWGPSFKDKRLVLSTLAWRYLDGGVIEMERPELEAVVEAELPRLTEEVAAGALVDEIVERSGVLVEPRLGRYAFAHRALADYLAAAHAVENELDARLLSAAGEERWREVILIAAGLAPADRARRLVERAEVEPAALEVAGHALAEDVQLGDDLRAEVRRRLVDRLREEPDPAPFGRLAGALLAGDPEAARRWMAEVLGGRDQELRRRTLDFLPELGAPTARGLTPMLVELVAATGEPAAVRGHAAVALGRLEAGDDPAVREALAAARGEADDGLRLAATHAWCALGRYEELGLVEVPAGEFVMGSEGGHDDEKREHRLFLPTFYIGRYPTTVEEFRRFVEESGFRVEDRKSLAGPRDHPVVWVSWDEALAYARWRGLSLPSEAEWEKAARGPECREWPWGDEWDAERANTGETELRTGLLGRLRGRSRGTTPVGRFSPQGDSPYGCSDMAGNVWEWTRSLDRAYPYDPADGREALDPSGAARVCRGGSWGHYRRRVRAAYRNFRPPYYRNVYLGFRVVSPCFSDLWKL